MAGGNIAVEDGSIGGIVEFGHQLSNQLQIYMEGLDDAEDLFRNITFEINATASALRQLQSLVDTDFSNQITNSTTPILFKPEGITEIADLARKVGKVYTTIVTVVFKAGPHGEQESKLPVDVRNALTLSMGVIALGLKECWLEPRIERCQEQLKWLRMNALLMIQLGNLAKVQLSNSPERMPGSFEEEMALRGLTIKLRQHGLKQLEKFKPKDGKKIEDVDSLFGTDEVPVVDLNIPVESVDGKATAVKVPDNSEATVSVDDLAEAKDHPSENPPTESMFDKISLRTKKKENLSTKEEASRPGMLKPMEFHDFHSPSAEKKDATSAKDPGVAEPAESAANEETPKPDGPEKKPETTTPSTPQTPSKFTIIPSWLSNIFSPQAHFPDDSESQTLEAYIVGATSSDLTKIPFGHKSLASGLKRMKKTSVSWEKFIGMNEAERQFINRAINEVKKIDPRERNCVSVGYEKLSGSEKIAHARPPNRMLLTRRPRRSPRRRRSLRSSRRERNGDATITIRESHQTRLPYQAIHVAYAKPSATAATASTSLPRQSRPVSTTSRSTPRTTATPSKLGAPESESPVFVVNPAKRPSPGVLNWMAGRPNSTSDTDSLYHDSDIEEGPEDLGIEIDYEKETENGKLSVGNLLGRFTYALDTMDENLKLVMDAEDDEDDSSDGSRSYCSD
ncbi:hypothetical protein G7Y89_g2112 [Cudoniella acicularis]|uniref:Uncharacterized protein n=1 Tax=Cudoniella acicularis TaxID=354080 RepID=A0A8H4W6T3_9HELO|nr:hypothetical protein G7Y89_g2112 [Cudoniella acicularis]